MNSRGLSTEHCSSTGLAGLAELVQCSWRDCRILPPQRFRSCDDPITKQATPYTAHRVRPDKIRLAPLKPVVAHKGRLGEAQEACAGRASLLLPSLFFRFGPSVLLPPHGYVLCRTSMVHPPHGDVLLRPQGMCFFRHMAMSFDRMVTFFGRMAMCFGRMVMFFPPHVDVLQLHGDNLQPHGDVITPRRCSSTAWRCVSAAWRCSSDACRCSSAAW